MDFLDDIFSEPSSVNAPAANRFKPKAKPRPPKRPSVADKATEEQPSGVADKKLDAPKRSSFTNNEDGETRENECSSADTSSGLQLPENITAQSTTGPHLPVDMATMDASNAQNAEEIPGFPEISLNSPSPFRKCTQNPHDLSTTSTYQDSGDVWIEIEEGAVGFSCNENQDIMSESAAASGKRPVKFQPKPKPQSGRVRDDLNLPYENENTNGDGDGSIYTEEPRTMSSPSNANLDGCTPCQDPDECGKLGKSTASDGLISSDKSLDSEPSEHGCETNNGVHDQSSDQVKNPDNVETSKKRKPRKCKKVASENEELGGKKSKKAKASKNDKSGEKKNMVSAKVPDHSTKKVPRAPRRIRCVNKALLEADEDEIDLLRVPIRDLIILADYKERQAKKNTDAVQPPLANEGTENNIQEDTPYEDYGGYEETYDEDGNIMDCDENGDPYENPSTSATIQETGYYNYHSFREKSKATKVRWSKAETELFYQGVRQFGSDFLMIQKFHFPTKTRNQIKLKYKKEERENPAVLHDALNGRTKDLSHFQLLAQRVKKEAAEENDMYGDDDDSTGQPGEEEEDDGTNATSKEEAEDRAAAAATADQVRETAQQDEIPAKSNDSDNEDEFNWDDYKSEF